MASHMKSTSSTVTSSLILPEQRVLAVNDMTVRFANSERTVDAVRNLSFHVDRGETLAIVGESGSGKSVTSLALMRLVEHGGGKIVNGSAALRRRNGQVLDVVKAGNATMRDVRGADVAMIFQEPMTSLNPVFTAGEQIAESIRNHQGMDRAAARAEALRMLDLVRIPEARNVLDRFPHQLSGGMRQRVAIARSLAYNPDLLLMDEPFAALDAQTREILQSELLRIWELHQKTIVFITHSLDEAIYLSDRIAVMTHRPGRIKAILDVPLPRPRAPEIRNSTAFVQLRQQAWEILRDEVAFASNHRQEPLAPLVPTAPDFRLALTGFAV